MNSKIVRDEVGNIYEAIRFADDEAGDVKINIKHMNISKPTKLYINKDIINKIPENPSELIYSYKLLISLFFYRFYRIKAQ
jgi:hypothetical protein